MLDSDLVSVRITVSVLDFFISSYNGNSFVLIKFIFHCISLKRCTLALPESALSPFYWLVMAISSLLYVFFLVTDFWFPAEKFLPGTTSRLKPAETALQYKRPS